MKIAAALAVLVFGSTAAGAATLPTTDHFSKAGYVVDVSKTADTMVLTGRNPETKATFRLVVDSQNHVVGTWNGQPVDYVIASNGRAAKLQTVALAGR